MKKTILFCVLALTSPIIMANGISVSEVSLSKNTIQALSKQNDIKLRANKNDVETFYAEFYEKNPNEVLVWSDKGKISEPAKKFITLFNQADKKALFPSNYHVDELNALMSIELKTPEQEQLMDLLLTDAALSYLRDISVGQPELFALEKKNWLLPRDVFDSVDALQLVMNEQNLAEQIAFMEPTHEQYKLLMQSLQDFLKNTDFTQPETQVKVGGKLSLNDNNDRVVLLNNRLIELGYLDDAKKDQKTFDASTKAAVQSFQSDHLLEPDGVVGARTQKELNKTQQDRRNQLIANIERWRWMPKDLGEHYLVVDIPSFEYYVVKDGEESVRAKTIVGMAQRSTPVFMAPMNHIVFAPYWHVPRSMAVRDKLPQLKKDPERLARSKIRVLDREGNEIDPTMVDWSQYSSNNFPYRLRQDPGSYNALGKVKFMFPNEHAIYLHDTPQKSLFGKTERTFSSGCIRIENPIELAEYFLKDQDWKVDRIQKAYDGSKEQTIRLKENMRFPVYTIYMTTAVDKGGKTIFRSDIYNRDPVLQSAIAKLIGKS